MAGSSCRIQRKTFIQSVASKHRSISTSTSFLSSSYRTSAAISNLRSSLVGCTPYDSRHSLLTRFYKPILVFIQARQTTPLRVKLSVGSPFPCLHTVNLKYLPSIQSIQDACLQRSGTMNDLTPFTLPSHLMLVQYAAHARAKTLGNLQRPEKEKSSAPRYELYE